MEDRFPSGVADLRDVRGGGLFWIVGDEMNLFNSLQAVAIYTAAPFGIQWLATNGYTAWAVILGLGEAAGFVLLATAVNDFTK